MTTLPPGHRRDDAARWPTSVTGPGPVERPPSRQRHSSAATLRLHATLVAGVSLCLAAGWFELTRALGGHEIAWVYTVEWPIFGAFGTYIWWRLWRADKGGADEGPAPGADASPIIDSPAGAHTDAVSPLSGAHEGGRTDGDVQLVAWQQYLRNLHAVDPPGGPPERTGGGSVSACPTTPRSVPRRGTAGSNT